MKEKLLVTTLPGFQDNANVGKISVVPNDKIKKGDLILTLEGKKGNIEVKSSFDGTISKLYVNEGDNVKMSDLLADIECSDIEQDGIEIKASIMPGFQNDAIVGKISKSIGDEVKIGDVLLSLEGKKGNIDLKSEDEGIVSEIVVEEGATINKDDVVMKLTCKKESSHTTKSKQYSNKTYHAEVLVLGGGPGGYVAAIRASQRGKKTILIEADKLGGTCLNRGCIPTKSMVQSTRVLDTIHEANIFGMMEASCKIDMNKIIERKNEVVTTLVSGLNNSMLNHDIIVLHGKGTAKDEKTIEVELENEKALVTFDDLILAPGSTISKPPIEGADLQDNLTSNELLDLKEIPKSLIILGGRVIAMEFAFIFSKLGSDVTVIQRSNSILPNLDDDIIKVVRDSAIKNGIKIYEGTKMHSIKNTEDGKKLIEFEHDNKIKYLTADKLAIATGRKPNLDGLNLDKLNVEISEKTKGIKVDSHMKTTANHIYAIGDATHLYDLAHVASKQGLVAVENIIGNDVEMHYNAIPEAIFTSPEIGVCGMTEKECAKQGIEIIIGKFPYSSNGKALVENATDGFIKVIARKSDRVIIGASLVGINAADLMCAFANLITIGATIDEAKNVVYAHPTVSETLSEALMDLDKESIHK